MFPLANAIEQQMQFFESSLQPHRLPLVSAIEHCIVNTAVYGGNSLLEQDYEIGYAPNLRQSVIVDTVGYYAPMTMCT